MKKVIKVSVSVLGAVLLSLVAFLVALKCNVFSPKEVKATCAYYNIEEHTWYTCIGEGSCSFYVPDDNDPDRTIMYCEGSLFLTLIEEAIVAPPDPEIPHP